MKSSQQLRAIIVAIIMISSWHVSANPICTDTAAWLQRSGHYTYFRDTYTTLADRMLPVIESLGVPPLPKADEEHLRAYYTYRHQKVKELIIEIGRLLPRVERAVDLPGIQKDFANEKISAPRSDEPLEYLRTALAAEMLAQTPDAGPRMAAFVGSLAHLEGLLLQLNSQGLDTADQQVVQIAAREFIQRFIADFKPITAKSIHVMNFQERIASQINALCIAQGGALSI